MEHPDIRGLDEWRLLARGSSAVVWEARQTSLERPVAVKVYQGELGADDQRRFLREAAAVGRLSGHPGIVTTHDAGVLPDHRPYLVVELCPGGSLTGWLDPGNQPTEEQVRRIGVRTADALAAAHAAGVLHGDVNPANILVDEYDSPRLADFGLAAIEGMEPDRATALRGDPAYAPPEAFRLQPATPAGDVYSLAATLHALLAGRPPRTVAATDLAPEQLAAAGSLPIAPLPDVNWFLAAVLSAALSEDPAARPTASSFRDQLAALVLEPAPRRARGELAPAAAHRPGNRRDAVLALAVGVVAVLGAVSVWLVDGPAPSAAPPSAGQDQTLVSPPPSPAPSASSSRAAIIEAEPAATSAEPFQAVRIEGRHDARPGTFLRVQRWERGSWRAFPLPTRTDASGNFTAHVAFGQPGRYRVRVVDPGTGARSEPFELQIAGT